jgi:hypothetical protein
VPAVAGAAVAPAARRAAAWVALLSALSVAAPYLFTVGYAAPRFLLPAYALVAIPVAECLWWLVTGAGAGAVTGVVTGAGVGARAAGRVRPGVTAVVVLALFGHLAIQGGVLLKATGHNRETRKRYDAIAARLHAYGVRPPCVLSGDSAVPIAFYTGCASRQTTGPDGSITPSGVLAEARRRPVAVLVFAGHRPPSFAAAWRPVPLPPPPGSTPFRASLPPALPVP